jgi:hypothetical protein
METLKIDGEVVLVASLPDELKQVVTLYEYALNEEIEARKKLALVEAGRSDVATRLTAGYAKYKAQVEAAQAATAEQATETAEIPDPTESPE